MNNVFLITGASSDIGCSYIRMLAESKTVEKNIVIAQYNSNKTELEKINSEYMEIVPFRCDLANRVQVDSLIDFIREKYGVPTHILHLAAPKIQYMPLKKVHIDNFEYQMSVCVYSIVRIMQAFIPLMKKNNFGKTVCMLSACTLGTPPKYLAIYTSVKYALLGFIKSIAAECNGKNVTINGISPNMIETKFLSDIDPHIIELAAEQCVMKRNVLIPEVLEAIRFLFSEYSGYITGINLNLTGGDRM